MSDTLAVLDQQKGIEQVSGNVKLADDLLAMLIKELPDYKLVIEKQHREGNKEELRKIIHKIHGGLRYVGAPALEEIVSKTDYDLFALSDEQLGTNIGKIYYEIERLLEQGKYGKIPSP